MERRDAEAIHAIQSASPELAQWAVSDYVRVAHGEMMGWVAEDDSHVNGFVVARRVGSDLEILNIAVQQASRRQGIGLALVEACLEWGKTFHAERAFLEVRVSNSTALRFYERRGFQPTGRRPRYYTSPVEDALVLSLALA